MDKKICTKCKIKKKLNLFYNNKLKSKGKQSFCIKCSNIISREHYLRNKQLYKDKAIKFKKLLAERMVNYKRGLKCNKCGESRYWVLDFHHKNSTKKHFSISSSGSFNKFLEEVKKCEVLCSNCHRDFHYQEKKQI